MADIIGPARIENIEPPTPDYDVQLESLNQWQIAWRRFKRHRMAIIGSTMFLTMVVIGVVGPFIFQYDANNIPLPDVKVNGGRPPSLAHLFGEPGRLQLDVLTLVPNSLSPIIVATTLGVAGVIIGEAFVSFLGFGVDPSTPTLGNILSGSLEFINQGNWWWAFFPGAAIVIIVLGINFMGDGLRDALDPRARI